MLTYTVGGDTLQMTVIPPSIACPTCGRCLTVTDDACWACGRVFHPRELWEMYQSHRRGILEANAHDR